MAFQASRCGRLLPAGQDHETASGETGVGVEMMEGPKCLVIGHDVVAIQC